MPSWSDASRCATGAPDSLQISPKLLTDHKPAMCSESSSLRSVDRRDNKKSSIGPENSGATNSKVLTTCPRWSDRGNTNTSTGNVPPTLVWQRVMPCAGISANSAWLINSAPLLGLSRQSKSSTPVLSKSSTAKPERTVKRVLTAAIISVSLSSSMLFSDSRAIACAAIGL